MSASASTAKVADELIDQAAVLTGDGEDCEVVEERRENDRLPYEQTVTLTLLTPDGKPSEPSQVQALDISKGGMRIESRTMFRTGAVGIARMPRSDGKSSLVGVQVCHCRYVHNMLHHTGLRFVPLPEQAKTIQPVQP